MSNKLAIVAATFLAGAIFATSANALTIINLDKTNHDVRVMVTGAKKDEKVKVDAAGKVDAKGVKTDTVEFDCSKGCTAHLGKKDKGAADTILKGTEKTLTIKDNKLTAQ